LPSSGRAASVAIADPMLVARGPARGRAMSTSDGTTSPELAAITQMLAAVDLSAMTLDEQRRAIERASDASAHGARVEACEVGGVPCEWIFAGDAPANTVVAVRGGGYCLGR